MSDGVQAHGMHLLLKHIYGTTDGGPQGNRNIRSLSDLCLGPVHWPSHLQVTEQEKTLLSIENQASPTVRPRSGHTKEPEKQCVWN